jgi:uncharacterized protein (DUF58 family)
MSTLSPEVLSRIRKIELLTRRRVQETFSGAYHSIFKGRGVEFDAVRPYQYGDNVRDIDWLVSARMGEPYIKSYHEERELTVFIVVDASASLFFGTQKYQKNELAAEIGAILALSAITNNDKVGLLIFDAHIRSVLPPCKGKNHILMIIRDLMTLQPAPNGTDLSVGLNAINRHLRQRSIVFFISDFLDSIPAYERELLITAQKHDFIAVCISDPLENRWSDMGLVRLRDAETGEQIIIDTHHPQWRSQFSKQALRFEAQRKKLFSRARVDAIYVDTTGDSYRALSQFFDQRASRIRR